MIRHTNLSIRLAAPVLVLAAGLLSACATSPSSANRGTPDDELTDKSMREAAAALESHYRGDDLSAPTTTATNTPAAPRAKPATPADRASRPKPTPAPVILDAPLSTPPAATGDELTANSSSRLPGNATSQPQPSTHVVGMTPAIANPNSAPNPSSNSEPSAQSRRTKQAIADLLDAHPKPRTADLSAAARLAMIESLASSLATPDDASTTRAASIKTDEARAALTPQDAMILTSLRTLFKDVSFNDASSATAPRLARALDQAAAQAASVVGLTIPTIKLCTKVESLGRYTPMSTDILIAARPVTALVYTEVANFSQTPSQSTTDPMLASTDPTQQLWTVNLSQEIALYGPDPTPVWSRPRQTIRDSSRSRRRDYFLVQRIEIPANVLAAGSYTLKVTLRDDIAGATTEQIIPLTFVADRQTQLGTPKPPVTKRSDMLR